MRKKTIIELFVYIIAVAVAITLLLTSNPKQKPIQINSDFNIGDHRGDRHDFIPL